MRIIDIPENIRPRERMRREGAHVLNEAELLAVILQKGTKQENVIDMSNRLISMYGLDNLSTLSLHITIPIEADPGFFLEPPSQLIYNLSFILMALPK